MNMNNDNNRDNDYNGGRFTSSALKILSSVQGNYKSTIT